MSSSARVVLGVWADGDNDCVTLDLLVELSRNHDGMIFDFTDGSARAYAHLVLFEVCKQRIAGRVNFVHRNIFLKFDNGDVLHVGGNMVSCFRACVPAADDNDVVTGVSFAGKHICAEHDNVLVPAGDLAGHDGSGFPLLLL